MLLKTQSLESVVPFPVDHVQVFTFQIVSFWEKSTWMFCKLGSHVCQSTERFHYPPHRSHVGTLEEFVGLFEVANLRDPAYARHWDGSSKSLLIISPQKKTIMRLAAPFNFFWLILTQESKAGNLLLLAFNHTS